MAPASAAAKLVDLSGALQLHWRHDAESMDLDGLVRDWPTLDLDTKSGPYVDLGYRPLAARSAPSQIATRRSRIPLPRTAKPFWRSAYRRLPAGVSIAIASSPNALTSYGDACMSTLRISTASSKASSTRSPGTRGVSFCAHLKT